MAIQRVHAYSCEYSLPTVVIVIAGVNVASAIRSCVSSRRCTNLTKT